MTTMHEEFDVGAELDRALRGAVTGLAQALERTARARTDQDRATAAQLRRDWLDERDTARGQYLPWTRPGEVERGQAHAAARAWATAAAWAEQDPRARAARDNLEQRIITSHGSSPADILRTAAPARARSELDLAMEWAAAERPAVADQYSRARGYSDTSDGHRAAERELIAAYRQRHNAPPADGPNVPAASATSAELADSAEVAEGNGPAGYAALLDPDTFAAATPSQAVRAWRDATEHAATGDISAASAAAVLGVQLRARYGINPTTYLLDALSDRAANQTLARRAAEDVAAVATAGVSPAAAGLVDQAQPAVSRSRVVELNEQAQQWFTDQLRPGTAGHRYLTDRLGDQVLAGPWAVGYAPPSWTKLTDHLRTQGATDDEIIGAGLGRRSSRGNVIDAFRDRVMIGVRGPGGQIVGFTGRDLSGDPRAPKYVNTGATTAFRKSATVFGLTEAPAGAQLVRTEGAFDAIAVSLAAQAGGSNVWGVAPMGTALSDTQAAMIAGKSEGIVWLANDHDSAGVAANERDTATLAGRGVEARLLHLPGDDPAQAWQDIPELLTDAVRAIDPGPTQPAAAAAAAAAVDLQPSIRAAVTASPAATAQAGEPPKPYDRAAEADLNRLDGPVRAARIASGHGFSQPTAAMVQANAVQQRGRQARPTRTPTNRRGPEQTLSR